MSKNIIKAASVVLVMNLVSKVLGFVREMVIARGFGANYATDAYLVAYTLPYFLQAILGFALVTITVPILTKYLANDEQNEAFNVGSNLINITTVGMAIISVIGVIGAPILVKLTAPQLVPETATLAISLTRIMFPSIIFMSVGMVITGILNSSDRFAAGAFAPGFSNIVIIVSVLFFSGFGIYGLAVGTLISFVGFLIIQFPSLWRLGFRYKPNFSLSNPDIKHAMYTIIPIVLGTAVNQIYFAINRIFASGLTEGSITVLNYASKLMNLPVGVFVAAIVAAIYPTLSELVIKGDKVQLAKTMDKGMGLVALISLPASVGLIMLRVPIIQLLFEGGAFTHADTLMTADALLYFCVGLFFVAAIMVITRAYYAIGDVKKPVYTGLLSIVVNVLVSIILVKYMAASGLAFANSIAAIVNMVLLLYLLKKHLPSWNYKNMIISFLKIGLASLLMGIALYFSNTLLGGIFGSGADANVKVIVVLGILIGLAVYAVAVLALRVNEVKFLTEIISKKFKKSK